MRLSPEDIARILGVSVDADAPTVTRAYRTLAARYHPDQNPGGDAARARWVEVNEAYAAWCASRPEWADSTEKPPFDLNDIFSSFGAMFGGAPAPARGVDLALPLRLAPSEAATGARRVVDIQRGVPCEPCRGSGARDSILQQCPACGGARTRTQTQGFFQIQTTCASCAGAGRIPVARCRVCDGKGLRPMTETITVIVPPEMETGMKLRIPGKGGGHASGPPGDLYLEIVIADELAAFVRRGDDAVVEVAIGARHVLFGGALEVPTLDGKSTVRVPRGVSDRHTVRLEGKGHPRSAAPPSPSPSSAGPYRSPDTAPSGRGDQLVVLRVPPGTRTRARLGVVAAALAVAGTIAALWLG